MKRTLINMLLALFFIGSFSMVQAQESQEKKPAYEFTMVKENASTPVKNQFRSGTCWSFSAVSMLESELLRMNKGEYDLSDMFAVYYSFIGKADKFARYHGQCYFPTGGASNDVTYVLENYGIVPEEAYAGINYDEPKHNHSEMDKALSAYLKGVINENTKKLQPTWKLGFSGILDAYLGAPPTEFTYKGKKYTPKSFAKELGLNASDYVKITSFTHHPFYTQFEMEVPDNWNGGMMYNLPLDEFRKVVDNAINQGYTMVWGGDVSEKGFSWKNGVAIVPDEDNLDLTGTDRDRLAGLSEKQRVSEAYKFEKPVNEKVITQEMRQQAFDDYSTSDDHGMHLVGIAKDQNGTQYYKIKNSWDIDNPQAGFIYMSMPYFDYKTLDIMVHKNALPKDIKQKLGIK